MRNKLKEVIESRETETLRFIPTKKFYREVNISFKRFGSILRNEEQPDLIELKSLADYFNVHYTELVDEHGNQEGVLKAQELDQVWLEEQREKKQKATKLVNLTSPYPENRVVA